MNVAEQRVPRESVTGRDSLDVCLEDPELHAEVEMTLSLIVAANDAEERVPADEVDRILGVRGGRGGQA
ncbi:MAG TPA: hypothetical protein VFZ64_13855 [Nocardioidaceae bacterium]